MSNLAQRLKTLRGSGPLNLSRHYRIGMWPCQSEAEPEVAMGLMTVLGYLLEQWPDIHVYRLFVRADELREDYAWTIPDSQFSVDDWQLDDLDENVAVWGTCKRAADSWLLQVEVENDLADADSPTALQYRAENLRGLVEQLPKAASDAVAYLEVEEPPSMWPVYALRGSEDAALASFLKCLFRWELNLLLVLWGKSWPADQVESAHEELMSLGQALEGDFGAWCVATATARAMLPGFSPLGEALISSVPDLVDRFPETPVPALVLAGGLLGLDYRDEAFDLLESNVERHTTSVESWLALAESYRRGERVIDAADAFQRAINAGVTNSVIMLRYADLLAAMDSYYGVGLPEFVLIDPKAQRSELLLREAVEACEKALDDDPGSLDALYKQLIHLVDVDPDDARFWPRFERLVSLDEDGELVRNIVDSLYSLEDISPALSMLRRAVADKPDRGDLHLNLAAAYLVAEEEVSARSELDKSRALTSDPAVLADIDRLTLAADDPEFEVRLGEITDMVGAGGALEVEDVDFLEEAIARVPTFVEGYLLLARGYVGWHETDAAVETLLDAHKHVPDDPEIVELLARLLWGAGEQKLAFDYLNKGLATSPNYVPLLALAGQYLFEDGQDDKSRAMLARAELINPQHPALNQARVSIARLLSAAEDGAE